MIDEDIINNIKKNNDIVDVIGEYIPLVQKGKNYFCVCPFHDDHSPSMSISRDKQIFRCFVCGASGNSITFVRDYLKITFLEAVKTLALRIGTKLDIKEDTIDNKYKELYDIYNLATNFYKNNLNSSYGKEAREYLASRSLSKSTIEAFDLGLSLEGGLIESLSRKYNTKVLNDIGLSNNYNKDIYTNRIMFPIRDNNGNAVAFSGRIYNTKSDSKYINSKESVIFKKSNVLYNFYKSKEEIRKKHEIIISEGFMEVIRLYEIGIKNTVALMGTSFTKEHLDIIKKLKCNVVLNLDQDEAGKIATINIGNTLVSNGINPSVIIFNGCKDADELIVSKGENAFINSYNSRVEFIDFKLDYLKHNKDLKKDEDLASYINESINAINLINDDVLREVKIKSLSEKYNINYDLIKSKITNNNVRMKEDTKPIIRKVKYNKYDVSELRILYLMMNYDEVIRIYSNTLGYLNNPSRRKLADMIVNYYELNKKFDYGDFLSYNTLNEEMSDVIKSVMSYNQIDGYSDEELDDYILRVKERKIKNVVEGYTNKMKETIDMEEKKELASKIEKMKKDVLKW